MFGLVGGNFLVERSMREELEKNFTQNFEELGIIVEPNSRVAYLQHEYEDRFVSLSIWDCGVVNPQN